MGSTSWITNSPAATPICPTRLMDISAENCTRNSVLLNWSTTMPLTVADRLPGRLYRAPPLSVILNAVSAAVGAPDA